MGIIVALRCIAQMMDRGLVLTDEEYEIILNYSSKNLNSAPVRINVNKANSEDLQKVLAISEKEAQLVIKYRTDHGNFKDRQSVAAVEEVDSRKIEAKKDLIDF